MARNVSIIDSHPERQRIIDLMLAGKSLRAISSAVSPRVGFMTLYRYKQNIVQPGLKAQAILAQALAEKGATNVENRATDVTAIDPRAVTRSALRAQPVLERMEKWAQERDEVAAVAREQGDVRGFAAVDRNRLTDGELSLRMAGLLDAPQQPGALAATFILLPMAIAPAAQPAPQQAIPEPSSAPDPIDAEME